MWQHAIRIWRRNDDIVDRPLRASGWPHTADVLEHRLVLGSLSAAPLVSDAMQSSPSATANSGLIAAESPSGLTPGASATAVSSVSVEFKPLSLTELPLASTTTTTDGSRVDDSTGNTSNPVLFTTTDSSDSLPSSGSTTSFEPQSNVSSDSMNVTAGDPASQSALVTPSEPVLGDVAPAIASPSGEIDVALTTVNQQVFLTADQIQDAQSAADVIVPAWFDSQGSTGVIHYDFRDHHGFANQITDEQIRATEQVLEVWSEASGGRIQFVRDTQAPTEEIVNIGLGDLSAIGQSSAEGGTLGTTRSAWKTIDGNHSAVGSIWMDASEPWTVSPTAASPADSVDFATVMAHEAGHVVGLDDDLASAGIMNPNYGQAADLAAISTAIANPQFFSTADLDADGFVTDHMTMGYPQLVMGEVDTLLQRASAATPSNDAIIAIVDRNGTILGVRAEQDVLDTITDDATLAFAIDGAVSKARTAAFFANDTAPLTSRTVRNLSQTTILEREIEANPNNPAMTDVTVQGPGFVAPIGIGGHFPADVLHTPPVDLFDIEASNRDSEEIAGRDRFNIDPTYEQLQDDMVTPIDLVTPISYGTDAGLVGDFQNRGIATLPGGIPIFRDTNGDGFGDTLIGGIGVFFPGTDGYATFEQGFVPNVGQSTLQRTNSDRTLEAEFIALAALGGSKLASQAGVTNAVVGDLGGVSPVAGIDLPFGFLTLVGVGLEVVGPTPGTKGPQDLINRYLDVVGTGTVSGANQLLDNGAVTFRDGASVPDGYLVMPHDSTETSLTAADMDQIIQAGINASNNIRAAIRLGGDLRTGAAGVRMTFAITDTNGEVLALYRMEDSTVFSMDVAVAKARNVAYYADAAALQPEDQVAISPGGLLVEAGTAFTNRTFRFLAEPRYPSGVDDSAPPEFSILTDAADAGIDPATGENIAGPAPASAFTSVMGNDVFNPGTNFHDPSNLENQNGIIFFPGSMPLYKDGVLVGGFGVSGDGVDQDDVVTFLAAQGFLPDGVTIATADQVNVNAVRLPFQKFNRNPFGFG